MKYMLGILTGIALVLCLAATYRVVIKPDIYVSPLDPNDPIYKGLMNRQGLSINKNWLTQFGDCERTLVFYHLTLNRLRLNALEKRLEPLPPDSTDTLVVPDANEANNE